LLGAGGFGEVWLARHSFIPQPRAVKFCTDPKVRAKLTSHEGRVIARVMEQGNHPNVVPLLDAVLDGESPWLMYEYVGGGSLTDLVLRWQGLAAGERETLAVWSLAQLASAVGTFHRLKPAIVHRDLKPANILLHVEGRSGEDRAGADGPPLRPSDFRLKITDFGIGGVAVDYLRTHPGGLSLMTGWLETSMRGSYTPLYASPQQARGSAPDPRDDVHALGVIGFQMLTGKLNEAPTPRFERDLKRRGVSEPLIELIGDCVDSEPSARPKDAADLAERLGKLTAPAKPAATMTQSQTMTAAPPSAPAKPAAPAPPKVPSKPAVEPTGMDGGAVRVSVAAPPPPTGPTKWLIPLRAIWFSRPLANPDLPWAPNPARLPGEVVVKPGEAYRLTLNPDTTGDAELEKLRALAGLPGLEAIDLSGCVRVTDKGLMHLAVLRGLKAIGLAETQVSDSGLALLCARFPELEAVGLSGAGNVSQAVVPDLARLRKLKLLALPPRADTTDVRVEFAKRRPACQLV
jgi:serine/threonine protein kinase